MATPQPVIPMEGHSACQCLNDGRVLTIRHHGTAARRSHESLRWHDDHMDLTWEGPAPRRPAGMPRGNALRDEDALVIPVVQERLHVQRQVHEHGVRVHTRVHEDLRDIQTRLMTETLDVQRTPAHPDQLLDTPPAARQEGDTWIIPVVEEVAVVVRRYRVTEEVRITRRRREEAHTQRVPLRRSEVTLEPLPDTRHNPQEG